MATATAKSSQAHLWIKASPRGTRSGFVVLPDGAGGRVTITVLPKPWSPKAGGLRGYSHVPGSTTHVVMYETEQVAISTAPSSVGALAMSLGDTAREQSDLLGLGVAFDDPKLLAPMFSGDPFSDLIDLALLAERGNLRTSSATIDGVFAPSMLRLLTHERLLKVVESLIFRARPRYVERTELLGVPRGRVGERSLLFSLATGTPRLESTFDELTIDTPQLQVVASALRVVASERLPRKIASLRPGLQTRAVHLLRYLSGVRLIDRERALLTAEGLWLNPLDRPWEAAIDAALPVLRDRAVHPKNGPEAGDAVFVHVATEKFWEQCLQLALESVFPTLAVSRDAYPGDGVSVPAPWTSPAKQWVESQGAVTKAFPDFMFRLPHRVAVADAKYKLGVHDSPSSQDGYQLFAYSHLATLDGQASDFALILYPLRSGRQPHQLKLERLRDRDYPLWLVSLPFPTRTDLQSRGSWSSFVARLAGALRELSLEWLV